MGAADLIPVSSPQQIAASSALARLAIAGWSCSSQA